MAEKLEALEDLKKRVEEYGRLRMARKLGMHYSTLCSKLNGYCTITSDDIVAIVEILEEDTE